MPKLRLKTECCGHHSQPESVWALEGRAHRSRGTRLLCFQVLRSTSPKRKHHVPAVRVICQRQALHLEGASVRVSATQTATPSRTRGRSSTGGRVPTPRELEAPRLPLQRRSGLNSVLQARQMTPKQAHTRGCGGCMPERMPRVPG